MKSFSVKILSILLLTASVFADEAPVTPPPDENFDSGMALYARGDYAAAKPLLEKTDQANPHKAALSTFLLASIAAFEGRGEDAMKLYEKSFANPPKNNELNLALSFAQFADANAVFLQELEFLPKLPDFESKILYASPMLSWYYARALSEGGKRDESLSVLSKMWDKFLNDPLADSCDLLAIEVSKKSRFAMGFSVSTAQAKAAKTLVAQFRTALAAGAPLPIINADNVSELSLGGILYYSRLGNEAAKNVLWLRSEETQDSVFKWEALWEVSKNLILQNNYAEALRVSALALSAAPDELSKTAKLVILQGDANRLLKNYEAARKNYLEVAMSKAVKGEPLAEAIYKLGVTWYDEGDYVKAHTYFERVYVAFFPFEYWASRAYLFDAKSLIKQNMPGLAANVLREYVSRTEVRSGPIYEEAVKLLTKE